MKFVLILSCILLVAGCKTTEPKVDVSRKVATKNTVVPNKPTVDNKKRNVITLAQQKAMYLYTKELRAYCSDDHLNFMGELGRVSREDDVNENTLLLIKKYQNQVSVKPPKNYTRPAESKMYKNKDYRVLEKQARSCRISFKNYLNDMLLSLNDEQTRTKNISRYLYTKTALFSSTYALEYRTYKTTKLPVFMSLYSKQMHENYRFFFFVSSLLRKESDETLPSYFSELVTKVEKIKSNNKNIKIDFKVLKSLYKLTNQTEGKNDLVEHINILEDEFIKNYEFSFNFYEKNFNKLKASNLNKDSLLVFLMTNDGLFTHYDQKRVSMREKYQKYMNYSLQQISKIKQ